jgi:NTP pyrophosphatase (non-canonical NTP hydrolase)
MSEELKPCPHCGGQAIFCNVSGYPVVEGEKTHWCYCGTCDKVGIPYTVDFWNARPIEDALNKKLEVLEKTNTTWAKMINDQGPIEDALRAEIEAARARIAELEAAQDNALCSVLDECKRQIERWGEQNHDPFTYLTILTEEVGEYSEAILHTRFGGSRGGLEKMRKEAVQITAVGLSIIRCLDRGHWEWGKQTEVKEEK